VLFSQSVYAFALSGFRVTTHCYDTLRPALRPRAVLVVDQSKSLDDLAGELRSMALLLPPTYAAANLTRSTNHTHQKHTSPTVANAATPKIGVGSCISI
jgi:hypothetical protein